MVVMATTGREERECMKEIKRKLVEGRRAYERA